MSLLSVGLPGTWGGRLSASRIMRASVASRLAILAVLLGSTALGDPESHADAHWIGLAAYAGLVFALTRGTTSTSRMLFAIDVAFACYVVIEHAAVSRIGSIGGDVSSQLPALLLLLSTALEGRARRTLLLGVTVATAQGAAAIIAAARGAGSSEIAHLAVASSAYVVSLGFVLEGVARLRESIAAALAAEREREFLARFVPPGTGEVRTGLMLGHACLLAVDVRGFSDLTRRHSLSEVACWLLSVRRMVNEAVAAEGGTVDKYVGDGIITHFTEGSPAEQAYAAWQAVERIQRELAVSNEDRCSAGLEPLKLSFALHAGAVLSGVLDDGLRAEMTMLGAPMNALARIEKRAKAEGAEILASKRFARLLGRPVPISARLPRGPNDEDTPDVIEMFGTSSGRVRSASGGR